MLDVLVPPAQLILLHSLNFILLPFHALTCKRVLTSSMGEVTAAARPPLKLPLRICGHTTETIVKVGQDHTCMVYVQ